MSMKRYGVTYTIDGKTKEFTLLSYNETLATMRAASDIVRANYPNIASEDELLRRVAIEEYDEYDIDELSTREYSDCMDTLYRDLPYYCSGDYDWEDDAKNVELSIEIKLLEGIA